MVRVCRNCGLLERHHDAPGQFYGFACDDFEERDEWPDAAQIVKEITKCQKKLE